MPSQVASVPGARPRKRSERASSDASAIRRVASVGSRLPYNHEDERLYEDSPLLSRYRYYSRLDPSFNTLLRMPDHVVPPAFFNVIPVSDTSHILKQGSWVTVFSIWNTMMGTALLSMPWALAQAGFVLGIILMVFMSVLCFYTAYRVIQSPNGLELNLGQPEFADVCRHFWGRKGELLSVGVSILVLSGAAIVYWVLMSNFLYFTGIVIYESLDPNRTEWISVKNRTLTCDVKCVGMGEEVSSVYEDTSLHPTRSDDVFYSVWQLQTTIPFFLILVAFPLLNFESPTFFTKFNVLGTFSVMYLIIFVCIKASECGINFDMSDMSSVHYSPAWSTFFPALTGILSLSFFLHNAILSILRNQKYPIHNVRDLSLGYLLVALTYLFIAILFFLFFPLAKNCISDNFLNNFKSDDLLSSIARLFLLFQILTVFPLILYLIRGQLSLCFMGQLYPGALRVVLLNVCIIALCILFAVFYPSIGTIIRFVGSGCGFIYVFTLPCIVHMKKLQMQAKLTVLQKIIHGCIIIFGALNFLSQFALL